MTDHQDRAGETAPLKALSERWRSKAALTHPDVQYYYGGQRDALDACADELDAALSRLSAPQGETKDQELETRVAPLKAGDDGQDLPQSCNEPSSNPSGEKRYE
jgi:hypothetical protein